MDIKKLIQKDKQRRAINSTIYSVYLQDMLEQQRRIEEELQQRKDAEEAARKRQELERAVDDMAQQDQENTAEQSGSKKTDAGAGDTIPQLQASSYLHEPTKFKQSSVQVPYAVKDNIFKFFLPQNKQQESLYPKSVFDLPSPKLTMDTSTGLINWGQTLGEQDYLKQTVESTPLINRSKEDIDYYNQLKVAYLNDTKPKAINNNFYFDPSTMKDLSSYDMLKSNPQGSFVKWSDNTLAYYNQQKNKGEIDAYRGKIALNTELRKYAKDVQDYSDALMSIHYMLSEYTNNPTQEQLERINKLYSDMPQLAENARIAATYLDKDIPTKQRYINMPMGGAGMYTTLDLGKNVSTTPSISELVKSLNTNRQDFESLRETQSQLLQILSGQSQFWDKDDENSKEGIRSNAKDLKRWQEWRTVDPEYLAKAQAAAQHLKFTDPDTYVYGLGGVLGSSAAFNGIQWANMLLSAVGGKLAFSGIGAIAGVPLTLAGTTLGMISGSYENAMEVSNEVDEKFRNELQSKGELESFLKDSSKKLGKDVTFEDAMQSMALGEFEPLEKHKKLFVNSTIGAHNQFSNDMMAVTGSNVLETTINFVPFGKFAENVILKPIVGEGTQIAKLRRLAKFKQTHPYLYKTGEKLTGFSEGLYNTGAAVNPIFGATLATAEALTRPVTKSLSKKFDLITDWAFKAPKSVINAKTVGNRAADFFKRVGGTMWAESLEEGKQHYHAKEFAAGNYAGESDSFWDLVMGDIEGGSKSLTQIVESFLGLTPDESWMAEIRGGALGGGGHTMVVTGYANISSGIKQIQANNLVVNNILATKLQERGDIEKARSYASKMSFADRKAMNDAFDQVKEYQKRITERGKQLEDPDMVGIPAEDIEQQRKMYNDIFNLANSQQMQNAAKERGITPGSDRYSTLVALTYFARNETKRALNGITDKESNIAQTINQSLWGENGYEGLTDAEIFDLVRERGIPYERKTHPVYDQKAIEEDRASRRRALQNVNTTVDYIAHLDALLSYRDQLELKDNKTSADKRKLRSIQNQIDELRRSVKTPTPVTDSEGNPVLNENGSAKIQFKDNEFSMINDAATLQKYVYDIDLHEVIRDQYRDYANFMIDYDNALKMQYNLVGEKLADVPQTTDDQLNEILYNIDNDLRDQYNKRVAVTDNKNVKIGESGPSVKDEINEKAAKEANAVIDQYLNSVKSDEEFEQRIHDDMERAIREMYETPQREEPAKEPKIELNTVSETPTESSSETKKEELPKEEKKEIEPEIPAIEEEPVSQERVEFGDLYDYIDAFPLRQVPQSYIDLKTQEGKTGNTTSIADTIKETIDAFNKWIKDVTSAKDENGTVTEKERKALISRYNDLVSTAKFINEQIDIDLKYSASLENIPVQQSTAIINQKTAAEKNADFLATMDAKLARLQAFIQSIGSNPEAVMSDEAKEDLRQTISDLDEMFMQASDKLRIPNISDNNSINRYTWYFGQNKEYFATKQKYQNSMSQLWDGDIDLTGARGIVLRAVNDKNEQLPPPITPPIAEDEDGNGGQPPVLTPIVKNKKKAVIDKSTIEDTSSWKLITIANWDDPKHPGEGVSTAVSTKDKNVKLLDVLNNSDFVENAEFELITRRTDNNTYQPFVVITYKGHTFTPIFIETAKNQNWKRGRKFYDTIIAKTRIKGENQKVVAGRVYRDYTRTKEKIVDNNGNPIEPKLLSQVGLLTDSNLYTLEFSANKSQVGVTGYYSKPDGTIVIAVFDAKKNVICEYVNDPNKSAEYGETPAPGLPVLLFDTKFQEWGGKPTNVPINLLKTKIEQGDADLIVEILKGQHCADRNAHGPNILSQEYIQKDASGNVIEFGITNGEVLNLLMKYGYDYEEDRRHLHLEYNPNDNRFVSIVGFIEGVGKFDPERPNEIPQKQYNLYDANDEKNFKEAIIGKVNRNFNLNVAKNRVGERNADSSNPFKRLNEKRLNSLALRQMLQDKGKIKFGNSAIEFDIKDFVNEQNPDNSDGVSGIVWYARHGLLKTRFGGFTNTVIVFDEDAGAAIVDKTPIKKESLEEIKDNNEKLADTAKQNPSIINIEEQPSSGQEGEEYIGSVKTDNKKINTVDDDELSKMEDSLPSDKDRINIVEAKKNVLRMLGQCGLQILDRDKTFEQALNMFKNGPASLGLCKNSFLGVSKFARRGTEYHESFHKVCEILLSDKKRDLVYKAYAKAKHIKLYDDNNKLIVSNLKLVTEGLADEFMMWAMDRPTIKLSSIKEFLNSVKAWKDFYKNIGSFNLYLLYRRINSGKYANVTPTKEGIERFQRLLDLYKDDALRFSINGKPFNHILNNRQYRNLCDTMFYIILQSQKDIDKTGANIQDLKIEDPNIIREYTIFQKYAKQNEALNEMLDNWDLVKNDIRTKIEQMLDPYTGSHDNEDNVEDAQGDTASVSEAGIGDHIKESHEFPQFSRASSRVKFFFARIPNVKWVYEGREKKKASINNTEGLPHFVDSHTMYNTVLNQVYNCRSLTELLSRIKKIGEENAKFDIIYQYLSAIKKNADNGSVNDLSFLRDLCVNLHATKSEFVTFKAFKNKNGFDIKIITTGDEYSARNYRNEWSSSFANGASIYVEQDKNGNYVMKNPYSAEAFTYVAQQLYNLQRAVSQIGISEIGNKSKEQFSIKVQTENGLEKKQIDVRNPIDFNLAKSNLISILNSFGIMFNTDMLDYMLATKYGSSNYESLDKLFNENDFGVFIKFINGFNDNGKLNVQKTNDGYVINSRPIREVFNGRYTGFVGELAKWAYNYKKSTDLLSVFGNNRNKMYLISENNYITDVIDELNASIDGDNTKVEELSTFVYNYAKQEGGANYGSMILKNFLSKNPKRLHFITDSGFKTDDKDDAGQDYAQISQAQDEVSKIQILLEGNIIFPTMESKKTWGFIDGITLPGLDLNLLKGTAINTIQFNQNGSYEFSQNDDVLNQLREYAILEHQAVLQTYKDVFGRDLMTGEIVSKAKDQNKVKNYHKANVSVKIGGKKYSFNIVQGARYSTMYAIYDNKGRKISFNRVCDENGKFISEKDNIAKAMEYFYGVPSENEGLYWIHDTSGNYVEVNQDELTKIQKKLISRSLQLQLRKQMLKAERLGLIERVTNDKNVPFVLRFKNKLISTKAFDAVRRAITQNLTEDQKHSLALAIILNDVSCKSIMSLQETERIFSGHPAFYKWTYNSKGVLSDRSTDQHKRLGGLVSTGQNNAFVFKDLPTTYKAAELDDEEIESKYADEMEKNIYEGELRSTYHRKMLKEAGLTMDDSMSEKAINIAKDADELSIEEIESKFDDLTLQIIQKRATAKSNAFRKDKSKGLSGINVADGATYITDDMCENMLKMVGPYDEDVQRAFKVLRGEPVNGKVYTTKDIRELVDAYKLVTTKVIGTQKYTAYGFRKQDGVLIPYYNKTAIFPLFKSLCTGNMARLYDKMKKDGVDMVMMNSAVKVGSQGSQKIDWNTFEDSFKFNTYDQEYKYLRKQFNTDPKEKELMQMGTQMTKIVMQSMLPGKQYVITNLDGSKQTVNVQSVLDGIMDCINNLSNIGYKKLRSRLFDGDKLNVQRFSEFLIEELSNRGASRDLLDAVSVVDENTSDIDEDRKKRLSQSHKKELKVPLVALSGMNWIQSIINSKVNKSVVDINTPGAAFIQRSIFGMEGEYTAITQDNLPPSLYEGRDLLVRNENGSMDVVLSIDFFKNIIPKGLSFEQERQWLIDNKIISGRLSSGEWSDADASIIGYRIPTQAPSSIHAMRCVDVIETVSDTIILPKEFPAITGADFDIDKIFMSTFFYNTKDNNVSINFKESTEEYFANKLLSYYIALLKDSKSETDASTRTMNTGDGSIDSDTQLLRSVADDLDSAKQEEEIDTYDPYSLWRNTYVRDLYILGKFGIGPFALNNNNHILTMMYGVKFKHNESSILGILGHENLYESEDMYGELIGSWLSALINAHVDIAKDPFVSKLNINAYTYNLVNLMVRTGFGKSTFYFTTQPILKELAVRVNNAASSFGSNSSKSKFRRQLEAEENFIIDFANRHLNEGQQKYTSSSDVLKDFQEKLKKLGTSKTSLYKSIFDKKSTVLQQLAKSGLSYDSEEKFNISTETGTVQMSMYDLQMLMYFAKTEFDPFSKALADLVKYCKIDTKKQGKTVTEQRDFMRGYNNLFNNERSKVHKLFDEQSLNNLKNFSYVDVKTKNATSLFNDILADQLIDATESFNGICEGVLFNLPVEDENVSQDLLKKISNSVLISIRSGFFNQYAEKNGIDIRKLVSGNNTIYDRLIKLKIDIQTKKKYSYLRNDDGSIDNYLLNTLASGFIHEQSKVEAELQGIVAIPAVDTYGNAKFLSTMTFMDEDSIDADEMSTAWEELLEDAAHPEIQNFARDLIVYSFVTNGGVSGSNNIFKYVPTEWLVNPDNTGYDNSFAQYMSTMLENYQRVGVLYTDMLDDIILNNWKDNQFIPTVKLSKAFETFYTGSSDITIQNGKQVSPKTDIPLMLKCDEFTANSRFIKINRQHDKDSQRSVAIYKKVKTGVKTVKVNDIETTVPYNIYVLTDPKGQNFGNRNKIYEYGRTDAKITESQVQLKMLGRKFMTLAESCGADVNNIESVLNKLISFIEGKENKEGALEVIGQYGVRGMLMDVVRENTIEQVVEEYDDELGLKYEEGSSNAPTATLSTSNTASITEESNKTKEHENC